MQLMTYHASKGLEFQTVFLLDVNEGIVPHRKANSREELEEERRHVLCRDDASQGRTPHSDL